MGGSRVAPLRALLVICIAAVLGHVATATAAADTTIGFDDLAAGTQVSTQYQPRGLTFIGPTGGFGCGYPVVHTTSPEPRSAPNFARVSGCSGGDVSGGYGTSGFFDRARSRLTMYIRATPENPQATVTLAALDDNRNVVGSQTITADQTTWQAIGVAQPAGQAPRITSFQIGTGLAQTAFGIDDLSFDNPTTRANATFTTQPSPTFHGGGAISFGAKSSTPSPGRHIVSFGWDFNNDGQVDEVCGAGTPGAMHEYRVGGTHTARLILQTSDGKTTTTTRTFHTPIGHNASPSLATVSACLAQSGQQPSAADCVRTFQFNLVEVNARSSNCFEITTVKKRSRGARAASSSTVPLNELLGYHAAVKGPVSMNGLPIALPRNASSDYDSAAETVNLQRHGIDVGLFKLGHLDLNFTEPEFGRHGVHNIGEVSLSGLPGIGGLGVGAKATVDLVYPHQTRVTVEVKLPDVFSMGPGKSASGAVSFFGDNQRSFHLDNAHIHVDELFLGPLQISDFNLDYQSQGEVWNGTAKLGIPGGVTLNAVPPPQDNGIGFSNRGLEHAGAELQFDPGTVQVFPGISLTEIGFTIGTHPTRFTGHIQVNAAEIVNVDGQLFLVLASPEEPYTVPDLGAGGALNAIVGRTFSSTTFAAGGAVSLHTPLKDFQLGGAYVLYSYPSYFEFHGGIDITLPLGLASISGGVGGFVDIDRGRFNIEGSVDACIVHLACLGLDGLVSSKGIAACGRIKVGFFHVHSGFGYAWHGGFHLMLTGCDVGPYRVSAASVHGAANSTSFTVRGSPPFEMLEIHGNGGAPRFKMRGPHGETYATGSATHQIGSKFAFVREDLNTTTYVALVKPSAGKWSITTDSGSPGVKSVGQADGLPAPSIKVHVSGSGATRTLHYDWKRQPGEQVTFAEKGPDAYSEIGDAKASHGTLTFKPSFGRGGSRDILALVKHNGLITERLKVATFKVPKPRLPGRPQGIHVKRKGSKLLVSWGSSIGAARYALTIDTADGSRRLILTKHRKATVKGVRAIFGGTVSVSGMRVDNTLGPAAKTHFKRVPKHRHRRPH